MLSFLLSDDNDTIIAKMKYLDEFPLDIVLNGTYQLVQAVSDKVLDIYKDRTSNGANVQIWRNHRGENQRWNIYKNEDGTIKLINPKSGKALDVSRGRSSDGTNVQLYTDNGSNAQRWRLKKVGDGIYKLIHSSSGKALDLKGGATAEGTNVQIWSDNDRITQRWRLVQYQRKGEHLCLNLLRDNVQSSLTTAQRSCTKIIFCPLLENVFYFILLSEPWMLVAANHFAYRCPSVGNGDSSSLAKCQASCDATELCTAVNYELNSHCVLIQCSAYPPITEPTDKYAVWARRSAGELKLPEKANGYY
jgi:hypothetical protein